MNPNDILLQKMERISQDPAQWIEAFLEMRDVTTQELRPVKLNYPQRKVLTSKKNQTYFCIHRRAGKCLEGNSLVIGENNLKPLELFKANGLGKTLVYDFYLNKLVWSNCRHIVSGRKKCITLKLSSGIKLTLTEDHLLYSNHEGWIKASELKTRHKILAPSIIPIFGNITEEDDIEILNLIEFSMLQGDFEDKIFNLDRLSLKRFLKKLFEDNSRSKQFSSDIVAYLYSYKLAQQLHHLLLRFGISSVIDSENNIKIVSAIDTAIFFNEILGINTPCHDAKSPRQWDYIVETYTAGERDTYDLEVEHDDHNFVANDTIVHNSFLMTMICLWHALTLEVPKKLIVYAPSKPQLNVFFKELDNWVRDNPWISQFIVGSLNGDYPVREFASGTAVEGFCLHNVDSKRGNTGDIIFLDEAQDITEEGWKVLGPIITGDQYRMGKVKCYAAGTITDPKSKFVRTIFGEKPEDFRQVYRIPVTENTDYTPEMIAYAKSQATEKGEWEREWLLEIGESSKAVFSKDFVNAAFSEDWDYGENPIDSNGLRFIGIDWDKYQAGTNIAVLEYNRTYGTIKTIWREEIPREEFQYIPACERVLDLFEIYQPRMVVADQGQGEMQWEYLMIESQKRGSYLHEVLLKIPFNTTEVCLNPLTFVLEKKMIKPLLVGVLNLKLQEGKIRFPSVDKDFREQLLTYEVKTVTERGPKFSSTKEHIIDAHLFALYAIWMLYENPLTDHDDDYVVPTASVTEFKPIEITDYNTFTDGSSVLRQDIDPNSMFRSFADFNANY